jgi:endonuclease/exonuclease/phosphatase family metal-dependent hydrolase
VAPGASSPRVVTVVDLAVHGVSTVRVVNTHLDDRTPEARRSAAAQIAGWVAARGDDVPLVVAGDLNATLDDDELGPLLESGLVPTLAPSAGPTATAFETEPGRRLDHLLVSRHWEVLSSDVVTSAGRASDHYPVVADLRLL